MDPGQYQPPGQPQQGSNPMEGLLKALFGGAQGPMHPGGQPGGNQMDLHKLISSLMGSMQGPHGQAGGPHGAMPGAAFPQWLTQLKDMMNPVQNMKDIGGMAHQNSQSPAPDFGALVKMLFGKSEGGGLI